MTFEQTNIFRTLTDHFAKVADEFKNTIGKDEVAADLLVKFSKMHGKQNIVKVANKANQKAKVKFFDVTVLA